MKVRVLANNFGFKGGIYNYGAIVDMTDAEFKENFNSVVPVKEVVPDVKIFSGVEPEGKPINIPMQKRRGFK